MARMRQAAAAAGLVAALVLIALLTAPHPAVPQQGGQNRHRASSTLSWLEIDDLTPAAPLDGRGRHTAARGVTGEAVPQPIARVLAIKFGYNVTALRAEEVCGLESALRAYPAAEVVLLTTHSFNASSLAGLVPAYGRRIRLLDVTVLVAMLERAGELPELVAWFASGAWRPGFALNNLSNGFRLALVYLFGGAYFDLDILHLRAMPAPYTDVLVYQDQFRNPSLNNAVIRFTPRHPFLRAVVTAFVTHFNGTRWAFNGPLRFTQTYALACGQNANASASHPPPPTLQPYCATLTVLNRTSYYPIHYKKFQDLYQPSSEVDALLASDDVLGVHIWSAVSRINITHVDTASPLYKVARRACPATLERFGPDTFLEHNVRMQAVPVDLSSNIMS